MTILVRILLIALALLSACRNDAPEPHGHADEAHSRDESASANRDKADEGHDAEAPAASTRLRVDPGMLRDLRLTASPAALRPGGEAVSALGELGVDQGRYAEVAAPIAARIVKPLVAEGVAVSQGEPLAELESAELGTARGAQAAARARVDLAESTLARRRQLGTGGGVPRREIEEAESALASATAELAAASATLGALGLDSGTVVSPRFVLRAPIAGMVIDRDAITGSWAEPSRPLFRVANLERLWLTVHAFERDAVRVRTGAEAQVEFAALPGRMFEGAVELVGLRVDADSRTVPIRIAIDNPDGLLRPGMSATAHILLTEAQAVLVVPAAALQRLAQGWCVFLPRGEGAFEIRAVGRGRDLGEDVEILAGLQADETVVVEGSFVLKAEAEKAHGGGDPHGH